ncbi:hypothetical protein GL178_10980 [Vibrio toranzoniae]|uniref:hypothetical protein n=1 Tax=Vibrio toranzoniae TaxID=1194427 RepID=UPI0013786773|nr:hypothetical protein [Vibrio toranzoniae]NAZ46764.1 hypothetical protein [Vibrio toranzoniae]
MTKLLSLDVWDTLIRREVYPEYPKLYTMNVLLYKYRFLIIEELRCKEKLYQKRSSIEAQIAKENSKQDSEYSIQDVFYQLLRDVTGLDEVDELVEDLIYTEVSYEKRYTYPDPTIYEEISKIERDSTVFISDFYMGSKHISEILASNNVDTFIDHGFSSCELGANKRSKRLFKLVQNQLNVTSNNHTHIGDHEFSDFTAPKSLGINSIHFWPDKESRKRVVNERHWHSRESLLKDLVSQASPEDSLVESLTPLMVGFLLNIAEQALENDVDFIGFCTREGEFFYNSWKRLFPTGFLFGKKLPIIEVIEVSRMATFAPTITKATTEQMQRMWSLFKTQSVNAMLSSLNIQVKLVEHILEKYQIDARFEYNDMQNNKFISELFEDREFCEIIESHCSKQRILIKNYLGSKFGNSKRVAIVDIGWRGTIQDNICRLFSDVDFFGFYLGLHKFINEQEPNSKKNGYCFDLNIDNSDLKLLEDASIYEMLFNSPNGSVIGYKEIGGVINSEKIVSNDENETYFNYSLNLQNGIIEHLDFWSNNIEKYVLDARELRPVARNTLENITRNPEESLIIARSNLHHNEMFGLGEFSSYRQVPTYYTIFTSLLIKKNRKKLISFFRSHKWVQSIDMIEDSSQLKKKLLITILRVAKLIFLIKTRYF